MAPSKKRAAPSQGSTLFDFFGANSTKADHTSKKVKSASNDKTPKSNQRRQSGLSAADAITIMDEDELTDISVGTLEKVHIGSETKGLRFGDPILLASSPPAETARKDSQSETNVDNGSDRSVDDCPKFPIRCLPVDGCPSPAVAGAAQKELLEEDEWGLGDDEIVDDNEDEDDGVELGEEELKGSKAPCERVCPLCNISLVEMTGMEVDKHVNECIDASSSSRPQTPSKAEQPLRPEPGPSKETKAAGIFSILLSSNKENQAWKEAAAAEDRSFRPSKVNGGRRKAPFYKVMPGMPIAVDAFRYGKIPSVNAYFLSHAHSDHYTNLSSTWQNGPIYCSVTTANLIKHMLNVDPKWVHPLPNDETIEVPNAGGVTVTLIEANHCPGSSLFLFEGRQTINAGDSTFSSPFIGSKRVFRYLHCGDFRACPQHVRHPAVKGKKIDQVYLDTTYLNPRYSFPPQRLVIDACADLAKRLVKGEKVVSVDDDTAPETARLMDSWVNHTVKREPESAVASKNNDKVLIVVGTYSIGKERIVKAIAKAVESKIYCDSRKRGLLLCQEDAELHAMLTENPNDAIVHIVPLQVINSDRFGDYVERWGQFGKAVGFRPTGWTYSPPTGTDLLPSVSHLVARDQKRTFTHANLKPMRNSTPKLMLYGVPYSEHSSFLELTCFALSFDWGKMIATVNVGSATSRGKMQKWFDRWELERKRLVNERLSKVGVNLVTPGVGVIPFRSDDYW